MYYVFDLFNYNFGFFIFIVTWDLPNYVGKVEHFPLELFAAGSSLNQFWNKFQIFTKWSEIEELEVMGKLKDKNSKIFTFTGIQNWSESILSKNSNV
jgi:hypothetical protein